MSKARLVTTAVVAEDRSQGEVARAYGVWQGWTPGRTPPRLLTCTVAGSGR